MLDKIAVREAFRSRLNTLVVATTGSTTLAATPQGFTRTSGSFVTENFAAGQEVLPAGFPVSLNVRKIIESVTATQVTIAGGLASSAVAASGRTLTVGPPQDIRLEGTQTPVTPSPGTRPYWLEQRIPTGRRLYTFPAAGGDLVESGLYVVTPFALANKGIKALELEVQAILRLFTPGTVLLVGTSNAVRIDGDPGPLEGQFIATETGYESCQISIPWRGLSTNAIAA